MKRLAIIVLLIALCLFPVATGAQESAFFEALYDVPVMPGLQELPEQSMLFDKPDGRIATVVAVSSSLAPQAILRFYGEALPQLGWKIIAENQYVRDGSQLSIETTRQEGATAVQFTLSPAF